MSAFILALAAGALVGFALGALGGGGSVLAVPALVYLLGFTPAAATTASLIIVTATSLTALYTHARTGNVRWKAGALFAAAGLLPAAAAGAVAARLPQSLLTAAFAAVTALAAVTMLRSGRIDGGRTTTVRPAKAAGTGAVLGALTGLLGVGGGFLVVPALVNALRLDKPLGPAAQAGRRDRDGRYGLVSHYRCSPSPAWAWPCTRSWNSARPPKRTGTG